MAENPLVTITRLLGGIVLMQGRLGHQVLGQLLVMNSNEVAMAAASVVIAGTTGQRSAVGQMALRTVAPALAVRVLLKKQEERLERQEERLAGRERALIEKRIATRRKNRRLRDKVNRLAEKLRACEAAATAPSIPPVALLPAALPSVTLAESSSASPPSTPDEAPPTAPLAPRARTKTPRAVTSPTKNPPTSKRSAAKRRATTPRAAKRPAGTSTRPARSTKQR